MSRLPAFAVALALVLFPATAHGEFEPVPGSTQVELLNSAGQPENRAGAHPDRMVARFAFSTTPGGEVEANPRDIALELPPGLVGNARATPQCSRAMFALASCPPETQVGTATQTLSLFGTMSMPVYNVAPSANELAEFGFQVLIVPFRFMVGLEEDGGHHIRLLATNVVQEFPILDSELELWGVPADHQSGTAIPREPLLTNPTHCDPAPANVELAVRTWQEPEKRLTASAPVGPFVGCADLPFAPTLAVTPSHDMADTPTGIGIDLDLPQNEDPDGLAASHVESASVRLPPGFSLSPGVAHGLTACTDAQLGTGGGPPACPESSKMGTAELATPLLPEPLAGTIYFAQAGPEDPFRVFVAVNGPGFTIKLPGSLLPDPDGDRVTAVIPELPQLPFSHLTLRFKDGPRAPLASPPRCTKGVAEAALTPSSGEGNAIALATVTTGRGAGGGACSSGARFAPSFSAGASPAQAGRDSSFSATVRRNDGEQSLGGFQIALPAGLTARIAGAGACAEAAVAAAACPGSSRIGSIVAEAGAGPAPFGVDGDIYLTGPYGGGPFGLALVLRPAAGPFEIAPGIVRASLSNDPSDGHMIVSVDALPQALSGIPLRLRTLGIDIDRPGFMVNPTSCQPANVQATIVSAAGADVRTSVPFRVEGCEKLGFDPGLAVVAQGGGAKHPGLAIRIRPRAGDANMRSLTVKLPSLLERTDEGGPVPCSRQSFAAGACSEGSRVGSARALTPLLSTPLRGTAYMVRGSDVGAPQIWTSLEGQGMRMTVKSVLSAASNGQLRNTVVGLPDQPLTAFTMHMRGGRGSLLSAATGACDARPEQLIAASTARAQNGMQRKQPLRMQVRPSCPR
ncbi:MAG TPA: hypothetical protein VFW48_07215 [Solirubrobacterales bacterium]|nr:hypothetical protein [Solirubrobacterales bacterium]